MTNAQRHDARALQIGQLRTQGLMASRQLANGLQQRGDRAAVCDGPR